MDCQKKLHGIFYIISCPSQSSRDFDNTEPFNRKLRRLQTIIITNQDANLKYITNKDENT